MDILSGLGYQGVGNICAEVIASKVLAFTRLWNRPFWEVGVTRDSGENGGRKNPGFLLGASGMMELSRTSGKRQSQMTESGLEQME